jgi:hypothetical protein
MPFQTFTPQEVGPTATPQVQPRPLFGVDFRCIYVHDDDEICGHKIGQTGIFCPAHVNTPREGDVVTMGGPRIVPAPRNRGYNRCPTIEELSAHVQWVGAIASAQTTEVQLKAAEVERQIAALPKPRGLSRLTGRFTRRLDAASRQLGGVS